MDGNGPKTIAITGASGMIGRALAGRLAADGHRLLLLGRDRQRLVSSGLPAADLRALPAPDAPDGDFRDAIDGAGHVVHCAALNSDAAGASAADFMAANAVLAGKLAAAVPGRFIHFSSIRAVAGTGFSGTIDEATPPAPDCDYGRSKLAGERAVAEAFRAAGRGGAVILRPAPVYGPGMGGNLARLARLADSPVPLPLDGLGGARTILSVERLADAVALLLAMPPAGDVETFVVSDARPVRPGEIVAGLRHGLGRPRRLFALPFGRTALAIAGRAGLAEGLAAGQVCDPSALERTGWRAEPDTPAALAAMANSICGRSGG